ncbi:hypothetical protein ACSLOO_16095, partial [Klebsiella pneumoniae]|uniref:hypothetical protein n=1 Tax=Klebsiella pneumoniae TaxID=573 RepID=UPI003EDF2AA0
SSTASQNITHVIGGKQQVQIKRAAVGSPLQDRMLYSTVTDFAVIKRKLFCHCTVMIRDNHLSYKRIIWRKIHSPDLS